MNTMLTSMTEYLAGQSVHIVWLFVLIAANDFTIYSNYVTFRIVETRNEDWILYLHNHSQRLVSEQFRSRDLDEVVTKLKGQIS